MGKDAKTLPWFFSLRKLEGHRGKPARSLNSGWLPRFCFCHRNKTTGWWWMWNKPHASRLGSVLRYEKMMFIQVLRMGGKNLSNKLKLPLMVSCGPQASKIHLWKTDETKQRIKQLIDIYLEAGSVFGNHHQCFSYFASSSLSWRGPRAVWPTHIPWNVPKNCPLQTCDSLCSKYLLCVFLGFVWCQRCGGILAQSVQDAWLI